MQVAFRVVVLGEEEHSRIGPCGRRGRSRGAGFRQAGAHVLANPLEQLADAGVRQAASRLGDLGHFVQQLLFAGEQRFGFGIDQRTDGRRRHRRDLGVFLGLQLLFRPRRAIVVGIHSGCQQLEVFVARVAGSRVRGSVRAFAVEAGGCDQRFRGQRCGEAGQHLLPAASVHCGHHALAVRLVPLTLNRATVDSQRPGKGFDRRQQPLLQARDQQTGGGLFPLGFALQTLLAQLPVLVQQGGQPQLRCVRGQAIDVYLDYLAFGKAALDLADVFLQTADHDVLQHLLADRYAAAEPLRVQDFQQGGKAVRVAVVRRGRQEQPVLETRRQFADRPRDLRIDRVLLAAGRSRVVRFVQDEQRPAAELAQPIQQRAGVRFVDQQPVRDQESGMRGPRIHPVAPFAPDAGHIVLVEDLEHQPEADFQFVAPLQQHRRRCCDDGFAHLLSQPQLALDQFGFDRLAQSRVVGDEQIHAGQQQGFAQGFQLVGFQLDPGAERRLEQTRVGGGDAVPFQCVQVGGEQPRRIESSPGHRLPRLAGDDLRIDLALPQHLERFALIVVVHARQPHQRAIVGLCRFDHLLDQIQPLADLYDLAGRGNLDLACWHQCRGERIESADRRRFDRRHDGTSLPSESAMTVS